jgi:hypothetical protein
MQRYLTWVLGVNWIFAYYAIDRWFFDFIIYTELMCERIKDDNFKERGRYSLLKQYPKIYLGF